jgi:ribosomal protein L29
MNHLIIEYEEDFYNWSLYNAQLLREGKITEIDAIHIAEELESMGKRDKRELISRLTVLLAHLLKWQFQPNMRSKSWQSTIREQRTQIAKLLKDSPSLKPQLQTEGIVEAYPDALEIALEETGLSESTFPKQCSYSLEQLLNKQFYP